MDTIQNNSNGGPGSNPRPTDAIVEERVAQVYHWILEKRTRFQIVRTGSEVWGVSERQVDEYIRQAKEQIRNLQLPDMEEALRDSIAGWEDFVQRCIVAKDKRSEKEGRKQLDLLRGVERHKLDITSNGKTIQPILVEFIMPKKEDDNG